MNIIKKWNEDPNLLEKQNLQIGWFETTQEECLTHTEGAGYWQEGTVLEMLEQGSEVFTPSAIYRKAKNTKSPEEIETLKDNWVKDPCWDIEDTEGFEEYREELLNWRKDLETKHKLASEVRQEMRLEKLMFETGVADMPTALSLHTFEEIADSADYGMKHGNQLRVQTALVRATLLQAAQLKRIADALENMDDGDSLVRPRGYGDSKQ